MSQSFPSNIPGLKSRVYSKILSDWQYSPNCVPKEETLLPSCTVPFVGIGNTDAIEEGVTVK